jgi:hypothetical protein
MRFVVLYDITSMLLVTAIPVVWCYLSHIGAPAGPMLLRLWDTHGVHTSDLVALNTGAVLVLLLSITLLTGLSRRNDLILVHHINRIEDHRRMR